MLGLPTETEEDRKPLPFWLTKLPEDIMKFRKISEMENVRSRPALRSSFRNPSPHSSGHRMYTSEEYIRRATTVKHAFNEQLNQKSLKYNWHDAEVTVLEGVFARGDRKVAKVIEEAYSLGCIYDAWSENFDNEKWMEAFRRRALH